MKKVISLAIVLVLVISSFVVVFADSNMTAGEELKSLKLVQGDENGDLMEERELTRAQMMVMLARLNGKEEDAKSLSIPSSFTDDDDHWAEPYIAYAEYRSWTDGVGDGKFNPEGIVTEQMVATYMLRVLGYEGNWNTAIQDAMDLGIINNDQTSTFVRANAFDMMLDTVYTPKKDSEVALGVDLGVLDETVDEEEDDDQPVDKDAVIAAQALNDRKLKITFGQDVEDIDLDKSEIRYTINGVENTASFMYIDPSDTNTVITVESNNFFNRLDNNDIGTVTITNDAIDNENNSLDFGLNSTDAEPIKIEALQALNNRTVKVYFNQYVDDINLNYFSLEGQTFDNKVAPTKDKSVWELSFDSHTMGSDVLDFEVTNINAAQTSGIKFSDQADDQIVEMAGSTENVTGITDIGIYMTDAKTMEVKFYEPMDSTTLNKNNFTVDGTINPDLVEYDSDSYVATLTFSERIDTDTSEEHTLQFSKNIKDDNGVQTVNDDGEVLEMLFAGSTKTPVKVQIEKLSANSTNNTVTMTLDEAIDSNYTTENFKSDFQVIVDDTEMIPTNISFGTNSDDYDVVEFEVFSIEKDDIVEVLTNESNNVLGKYSQEVIDPGPDAGYAAIAK